MDSRFHKRGDDHYTRMRPELVRRGLAVTGAKLSDADRKTIRQMSAAPNANHTRIGRLFNVSRQTVWRTRRDV